MKKQASARPGPSRRRWLLAAALAAIAAGAYANTLPNGFTLDDHALVVEDTRIRSLARAGDFFTSGYRSSGPNSLYRPVTVLSYALNHAVTGPRPWGFHLVNLLLHAGVVVLVYAVAVHLLPPGPAPFLAALLFALHPIHTEAIANIAGRAELLAAAGVLGALAVSAADRLPVLARVTGAAGLAGLGLLAKENAVAVLPLWGLFTVARRRALPIGNRLARVALDPIGWGLGAVTVGYLVARHEVLDILAPERHPETTLVENPLAYAGDRSRILTAVKVLGRYLGQLIWPYRLSADYSFNQIPLVESAADVAFLSAAASLVALGAAALATVRRHPVYLAALAFFLIAILPVANLLIPIGAIAAERFLYLPSAAFCWALAYALAQAGLAAGWPEAAAPFRPAFGKGMAVVLFALVVPWAAKTLARNGDWHDDRSLFEAAARASPRSAKVAAKLGDLHFAAGEYEPAVRRYLAALRIYPDYAAAAINLAAAYDAIGHYDESILLLRVFEGKSGALETARLRELGRALVGKAEYAPAAEAYEKALAAGPTDPLVHRNLGGLYLLHLGESERGRAHLRRSLELAPHQPGADELRSALEKR